MPTPPEPVTPPTPDTDRASQMILLAAHYELHAGQNPWLRSHLLGPWPSLFGLQLLTALAECELAAPGLGFTLAADLARVPYGQGAKGRERFQNLLQKLIEVLALRTIITAGWPEGTAFRHEPVNLSSGKKPELAVETPEHLYLFEVKCPGLLDHQDNRHANSQQFPARSGFSKSIQTREGWLARGTTLPQDNKIKDFLVSAEEKFSGFQSDKPQTGVLIIAWDGFMYEPISSLRHPESGLLTDQSFFKDAAGQPAPFSAIDGVLILNHLAVMHAATHGRRHRLRPDAFRMEPASPSPNVWCPNPGGAEPPATLLRAFDAVHAEAMAQFADYAPQEFIFWTDRFKVARRHAAQRRKTARRYRPSPLALQMACAAQIIRGTSPAPTETRACP